MRVIAGEFRSRRLKTLPGLALRPTPDRLREALFNVLAPHIAGVTFLDAYAGSGSVGIEALSRGASHAVFVEKHFAAANMIRQNLASLQIEDRATVVQRSSLAALAEWDADIYFLDPPYTQPAEYRSILTLLGERTLRPQATVLVQHARRFGIADAYSQLRRTRVLAHGDNAVSFFVVS
jgi:16S rRNA (guanine(966)-N(2))-methyltransferase RsmD